MGTFLAPALNLPRRLVTVTLGTFSETGTMRGLHIPGGLLCSKSLKNFLTVVFLLQSYSPTVFERYNVTLQMQGKPVHLQIWDTAGRWGALGAGKRRGAPVNRH